MFGKIGTFLSESRQELQKVNWPTREELMDSTILVMIVTAVMSGFIFVVDLCISYLVRIILH